MTIILAYWPHWITVSLFFGLWLIIRGELRHRAGFKSGLHRLED